MPQSGRPAPRPKKEACLVVIYGLELGKKFNLNRPQIIIGRSSKADIQIDQEAVSREVAYARRMFADNDWPVIDVTRRSIEETAAAILDLYRDHRLKFIAT